MEGTLKRVSIVGAFMAMIALAVTPAFAADPPGDTPDQNDNPGVTHQPTDTPPDNQGTEHKPATPGPAARLPAKARAYGRYCKQESKKRSDAAEGTKEHAVQPVRYRDGEARYRAELFARCVRPARR